MDDVERHARAVRLNVPCPVCGAEKGSPCTRLDGSELRESHDARMAIATRWVVRRRQKSKQGKMSGWR
jgi:hypothetical protein